MKKKKILKNDEIDLILLYHIISSKIRWIFLIFLISIVVCFSITYKPAKFEISSQFETNSQLSARYMFLNYLINKVNFNSLTLEEIIYSNFKHVSEKKITLLNVSNSSDNLDFNFLDTSSENQFLFSLKHHNAKEGKKVLNNLISEIFSDVKKKTISDLLIIAKELKKINDFEYTHLIVDELRDSSQELKSYVKLFENDDVSRWFTYSFSNIDIKKKTKVKNNIILGIILGFIFSTIFLLFSDPKSPKKNFNKY